MYGRFEKDEEDTKKTGKASYKMPPDKNGDYAKWTLTDDEEAEILAAAPLSEEDIRDFAKQFTTHPAIIIGRLQHKKLIPYSLGREYFEQVIFE